jgi:hypothetical protein
MELHHTLHHRKPRTRTADGTILASSETIGEQVAISNEVRTRRCRRIAPVGQEMKFYTPHADVETVRYNRVDHLVLGAFNIHLEEI